MLGAAGIANDPSVGTALKVLALHVKRSPLLFRNFRTDCLVCAHPVQGELPATNLTCDPHIFLAITWTSVDTFPSPALELIWQMSCNRIPSVRTSPDVRIEALQWNCNMAVSALVEQHTELLRTYFLVERQ